jgi:integrase
MVVTDRGAGYRTQLQQKSTLEMEADSISLSIAMLQEVIDGRTYHAVASNYGVTRTVVERRIKSAVLLLSRDVGIDGINPDGPVFVRRLRARRMAIADAIRRYKPQAGQDKPAERTLSDEDIELAVQKTRERSPCPDRDVALLNVLLTTGARPLEVARLEVRDYLNQDGSVRVQSVMRSDVAVNRKDRTLCFASPRSQESIDSYLRERVRRGFGTKEHAGFRGLDPGSRLFLTEQGGPFEIVSYGTGTQVRLLCRGILDAYQKIFKRIGLPGVSPISVRRIVAVRMFERGATEDQIGEILGISEKKSVRELLSARWQSLCSVMSRL